LAEKGITNRMTVAPFFDDISRIASEIPGFTPPDQLLALGMLAMASAPLGGDVIEIGSWCGRSATVLGQAVRWSGVGRVYAIDLFPSRDDWQINPDGSHSFSVNLEHEETADAYIDQTVWDEPFQKYIAPIYEKHYSIMDAFSATIEREGLSDIVQPYRGRVRNFVESMPADMRVRLAFIDGDHGYEAVCRDIEAVERILTPGGWITFDDAFSSYKGVDDAIRDRIINTEHYDCAFQISRKLFIARRKGEQS